MQKIGFFDSGVGGLTVLDAVRNSIDNLSYYYLGDTAHCPYGDRPLEEVRQFALNSVRHLKQNGCRHVVMACNISSSIALEPAREQFPDLELHGLINDDLVELIAQTSTSGTVGIMATAGTVKSEFYKKQLERVGLDVVQQACSPLVPMIEAGKVDGPLVEQTLKPLVTPLKEAGVDTIVLGCTHYPFMTSAIKKLLSDDIQLIDPGQIMARRLEKSIVNINGSVPEEIIAVTGKADSVRDALSTHFTQYPSEIRQVKFEEEEAS